MRQLEALQLGASSPAAASRSRRPGPRPLSRATAGDVARVVAGIGLLLVRGVVLLVDDDQAQAGHRRKHRRARADADARLAAAQPLPLVAALALAEGRVEDRDPVAEPRLEIARPSAG